MKLTNIQKKPFIDIDDDEEEVDFNVSSKLGQFAQDKITKKDID